MCRPRIPWLTASLLTLVSRSWAIPASDLFGRQSSTCPANFNQCNAGTLPDNFCCPSGTTCITLAGETSLLCCPGGSDCTRIRPISCNLELQNADRFPDAVIKTTALGGELVSCGTNTCCPFGYLCNAGNQCVKNINQNDAPVQSATPSPTPSPTPSGTGTSRTSSPTESGIGEEPQQENSRSGPPVAVIAGATVGAVAVIVGAAVIAFILARKRKKEDRNGEMADTLKLTRSTSSFGNIISNPIVSESSTIRTDFGRFPSSARSRPYGDGESTTLQSPQSLSAFPRPPSSTQPRTKAARQSSIAYGFDAPATSPYIYGQNLHSDDSPTVPVTPRRVAQDREPSSVSINVFADPRTLTPERLGGTVNNQNYADRYNRMTTFTQMMEEADLGGVARGQSYVPYRPGSTAASQQGSPSTSRRY
ncbi:hypothetical protein V8F33_000295 [Rhypophila sp. PSN 637]